MQCKTTSTTVVLDFYQLIVFERQKNPMLREINDGNALHTWGLWT